MPDVEVPGRAGPVESKPTVLVAMPTPERVRARLEAACNVVWLDQPERPTREELAAALPGVQGALIPYRARFDGELIAANPQLRVISNFGVGYDNIDVSAATGHGVLVCNTPGVLTDAVADLTLGLILAVMRRLVEGHEFVTRSEWSASRSLPFGADLRGKTLGIAGFGRIGQAVARHAAAFGMQAVYFSRTPKAAAGAMESARFVQWENLFRESDVVSIHLPLDDSTRGLIGAPEFALMNPSAYLVNTARGAIVRQAELAQALHAGAIAGAALDVFEQEPLPTGDPILSAPHVVLAPHIGSATHETRLAMMELAARNLIAAVTGGIPEAMVNPEVCDAWPQGGH